MKSAEMAFPIISFRFPIYNPTMAQSRVVFMFGTCKIFPILLTSPRTSSDHSDHAPSTSREIGRKTNSIIAACFLWVASVGVSANRDDCGDFSPGCNSTDDETSCSRRNLKSIEFRAQIVNRRASQVADRWSFLKFIDSVAIFSDFHAALSIQHNFMRSFVGEFFARSHQNRDLQNFSLTFWHTMRSSFNCRA